jgi:hypothetical protein
VFVWYHVPMRKFAALLAACLLLAEGAVAAKGATPTETKWNVRSGGFSILLPPKWYAVPRTATAVQQTLAALKKQKRTALASEYGFYLTAAGKTQLKAFIFQAFLDIAPSTDPIPPQVSVQVSTGTKPYTTADLAAAGNTFASTIASGNKGAKVTVPKRISLPEGPAELIQGTVPAGSGLSRGVELYLLTHKGKLYVLDFEIDATVLSQATVLRSIAENIRWL